MSKHRTARGREFNMHAFSVNKGKTVAVGNSGRNAQGDLLGSGGKILAGHNEIANKYHDKKATSNSKKVKSDPLSEEIVSQKEIVGADGLPKLEITYSDGSVEIKKSEEPKKQKNTDSFNEGDY